MAPNKSIRKSVLVVDDQPEVREIVRLLLEQAGHSVTEAGNGAEALECLETASVDVVLTDLVMPGMRGDALAAEIKRRNPAQSVLLMTASSGFSEKDFNAIDGFLRKPFTLETLRESVDDLLCASCV